MADFFSEATTGFLRPIAAYLTDPDVSEIMVNGPAEIYVEKKGKIYKTKSAFEDEEQLMAAVRRLSQAVGRTIDATNPMMDARLPDGSRVHVMIPPCARRGIYVSIRKFGQHTLAMKQLVDVGALSIGMAKFLNLCVALAKNIIVSGGTSSGKTTLLNVISTLIPPDQRIIVIEDSSELQLQQEHVLPMETRPPEANGEGGVTIRDLLRASLRMRPDRIVVGEVRGGEALDLLQALNTGHSGSMATIHANTPKSALARLETLALMSDVNLPLRALRNQVATAIEIVVQAARFRDGSRRITHISEVRELTDDGQYVVNDLFVFQTQKVDDKGKLVGRHVPTGTLPSFLADAKAQGFTVDETLFQAVK
ncbi:MAG TPA: CpaF family protein [Bdellovibrionota bacterium]|nr:CpaF family protein [Bdellovibrionota bacterium]